jgi:hypothetical protein
MLRNQAANLSLQRSPVLLTADFFCKHEQMNLTAIGFLDGPVFWALLSLVCLIGVPIAIIIAVVVLLRKKKPQVAPNLSAPPAPGSRLYQFARKGSPIGSFAEGTIQDLVASGQIRMDDDYWTEGMPEWKKVSDNPAWR